MPGESLARSATCADYFEYSSTMSCSRIGIVTSSRAGICLTAPLEVLLVELEPLRDAAAIDGLQRLVDPHDLLRRLAHLDDVARPHRDTTGC